MTTELINLSDEVDLWRDAIEEYECQLRQLPDDTDRDTRRDVLKAANRCLEDLDDLRKRVNAPYRAKVEATNNTAKQLTEHLKFLVEQQRAILNRQDTEIETKRREQERANAQELLNADSWASMPPARLVTPKPTGSVLVWAYDESEIVWDLLPDKFKSVNHAAIRKAMSNRDAEGLPIAVPGVSFFPKIQSRL